MPSGPPGQAPDHTPAAEVEQALRVADALPPGEEQVAAAERAHQLAEQLDEGAETFGLRVQARINLVAAYDAARPGERELPHIAWLLTCLAGGDDDDQTRGRLSERQRFEILWEARYALERTRRSSRLPLSLVMRVHADVERRFRAEDVSPHVFAKHRALLARDIDAPDVRRRWQDVWRGSPRDELSDCAVCDVADDARFLAEDGDLEGALDRAGDLLEGRRACDREPAALYPEAADWAMRLGRFDTAEAFHRAGWLAVAGLPQFAVAMAEHVMYLARAERPGRALRLVQQLVSILVGPAATRLDDVATMRTAAVTARVLRSGRGHRLAPTEVEGMPLNTAISALDNTARRLAEAFDQRNGTDRVSRRLANQVRLTPYSQISSPETRATDLLEVALVSTAEATPPTSPTVPLPINVLGYAAQLLNASEAFDASRVMALINGWAADRDTLLPVTGELEHFSAAYLDRRALASDRAQQDEELAQRLLADAAESAKRSGSQPAQQRVEVEVLHRQALAGDAGAWERAEKLVDELAATGELKEAASALMTLSRSPEPSVGLGYALRAADLFEEADQPRWRVTALQAAGYAAVWADPPRADGLLQRARHQATAHRMPAVAVAVDATRAKLAWQSGRLEEAIAGYRAAVAASTEVGVTDPLGLRSELCDVLVQAGRWEDLVDEAHALLERIEPGEVTRRALAHRVLGLGLLETGNVHEAAEVLEPAAAALHREGSPFAPVASWSLARALMGAGRGDLAAAHFVSAAEGFREQDRLVDAAAAAEAAGATLIQAGRHDQAGEQLVAAARLAHHVGDRHRLVSALRQLAWVQAASGRVNEALATLGSVIPETREVRPGEPAPRGRRMAVVDRQYADPISEPRLRGLLEHQAAQILQNAGRTDEARTLAQDAVAVLSESGEGEEFDKAHETFQELAGHAWTGRD